MSQMNLFISQVEGYTNSARNCSASPQIHPTTSIWCSKGGRILFTQYSLKLRESVQVFRCNFFQQNSVLLMVPEQKQIYN